MKIGIVGKPNVGKSTLFAAATMADAAIGNYPFTTIDANIGIGTVRVEDPGPALGVTSEPQTGMVRDGVRYVPVDLVDVAGLVPGAHEGRGLGNKFLTDLARADCLIHVVDASGSTDAEGNPVDAGSHDPMEDVAFLAEELDAWIAGLLEDGWVRVARRVQQEHKKLASAVEEKLSGLGVNEITATRALREAGFADKTPADFGADDLATLAATVRRIAKPLAVAWNKADVAGPARIRALSAGAPSHATSAQAELALRKAAQAGVVDYVPGAATFTVTGKVDARQQQGLDYIRSNVLEPFGSTGVERILEVAAFDLLGLIPVFPVEDEAKYTNKDGNVLPDCHLVPKGTTAKGLAYRVHSDLGDHFIRAIDCRTKRTVGHDHGLAPGDVIKIVAKA